MLDRILLNPENRLLGASTGDLSLYGGQHDSSVVIREAHGDGILDPEGSAVSGDIGASASASAPALSIVKSDGDFIDAPHSAGAEAATSFQLAGPAASFQPVIFQADAGFGPGVTSLTSSPAMSPIGAGAPAPALQADQGIASTPSPELGAQPISDAAPIAPHADAPVPELPIAAPIAENVASQAPDLSVAESVISAPTETVATTLDALADVGPALADTVTPIVDAFGATLTDTLSPIVETVGDAVTATVGGVTDLLEGVTGSDPIAGVATIVSLVSVSDMFDLQPVEAPVVDAASDGFAMLDALAGDTLVDDLAGHLLDPLIGTVTADHSGSLDDGGFHTLLGL